MVRILFVCSMSKQNWVAYLTERLSNAIRQVRNSVSQIEKAVSFLFQRTPHFSQSQSKITTFTSKFIIIDINTKTLIYISLSYYFL